MGVKNYNSLLVHPGYKMLTATQRVITAYIAIRTWDEDHTPEGKEPGMWWGGHRELAAVVGMVDHGDELSPGQASTISDHLRAIAKTGIFRVLQKGAPGRAATYQFDFRSVLRIPIGEPVPVDNSQDAEAEVQ